MEHLEAVGQALRTFNFIGAAIGVERAAEEIRLLRAIRDEYSTLLLELPGTFDTPAFDAYDAAQGDK